MKSWCTVLCCDCMCQIFRHLSFYYTHLKPKYGTPKQNIMQNYVTYWLVILSVRPKWTNLASTIPPSSHCLLFTPRDVPLSLPSPPSGCICLRPCHSPRTSLLLSLSGRHPFQFTSILHYQVWLSLWDRIITEGRSRCALGQPSLLNAAEVSSELLGLRWAAGL